MWILRHLFRSDPVKPNLHLMKFHKPEDFEPEKHLKNFKHVKPKPKVEGQIQAQNPNNSVPNPSLFFCNLKIAKISDCKIFEYFDSTFISFINTLYDSFRVQNNDANCKLHNIIASAASVSFREVSNTPFWNCPYCVVGDVAAKKRDWNRTVVVKCQKK